MTKEFKNIEFLRGVLKKVKSNLMLEEELSDTELYGDFLEAMNVIGKEGIHELEPEIFDLLEVSDEMIRQEAVVTLGFSTRLSVAGFKDQAYQIWLHDSSEDVRFSALSVWSGYYTNSRDKNALVILYDIFNNKNNSFAIREVAYAGILETIDYFSIYDKANGVYSGHRVENEEEFEKLVNWKYLNKIMRQYAPEVFPAADKKSVKTGYYDLFKIYLNKIVTNKRLK